jgi:hypothetical protein
MYVKKAKDLLSNKLFLKFFEDGHTLCMYPYRRVVDNEEYIIPCGKCYYCRTRKSSEWQARIANEITAWDGKPRYNHIYFITLTYNDKSLNERLDISYLDKIYKDVYFDSENVKKQVYIKDIQARFKKDHRSFCDKLRKFFKRRNLGKFKYFSAFEYGNLKDREHYHMILFIENRLEPEIEELLKNKIEKYWGNGYVQIRNVFDAKGVAKYVSKYVMKGNIKQEYGLLDKGKLFSLKSRRIGWDGYLYLLNNKQYDKINTIPRHLLMKIKEQNPSLYIDFISNVRVRNKRRLFEKVLNNLDIQVFMRDEKFDNSLIEDSYNKYVNLLNEHLKQQRRKYFLKLHRKYKL